ELTQRVGALMRYMAIKRSQSPDRLPAISTSLLLARDRTLAGLDLPEKLLSMMWIGFYRGMREGRRRLDAQVYSHHWPMARRGRMLPLDKDRDVPTPCMLAVGSRDELHLASRRTIVFLASQPS